MLSNWIKIVKSSKFSVKTGPIYKMLKYSRGVSICISSWWSEWSSKFCGLLVHQPRGDRAVGSGGFLSFACYCLSLLRGWCVVYVGDATPKGKKGDRMFGLVWLPGYGISHVTCHMSCHAAVDVSFVGSVQGDMYWVTLRHTPAVITINTLPLLPIETLWSSIIHDVWRVYENYLRRSEQENFDIFTTIKCWFIFLSPRKLSGQVVPPADLIPRQMADRNRFKRRFENNSQWNDRDRCKGVTSLCGPYCSLQRLPTDHHLTTNHLQTGQSHVIQSLFC
jgi:hypothetical protein